MEKTLFSSLRSAPGPILVTGHTGFKGAWLILLLKELGIPAVGYSLAPEEGSLYSRAGLQGQIPEVYADIRDKVPLAKFLQEHNPSNVLHMAAQPLVLKSYKEPYETFSVNVMGTASLLNTLFESGSMANIGVVTTDKVYANSNSGKKFIESDPLAGKDPYSASKAGTETVVAAWQQISRISSGPRIVSLRAGNVIGGGDFATDRIIPDLVRGYLSNIAVHIRNPSSTRPWQHALDPLLGYLTTLDLLSSISPDINAFNFGPRENSMRVSELLSEVHKIWNGEPKAITGISGAASKLEAVELGLDSTLSENILGWEPCMSQLEAIKSTAIWWKSQKEETATPQESMIADVRDFVTRFSKLR